MFPIWGDNVHVKVSSDLWPQAFAVTVHLPYLWHWWNSKCVVQRKVSSTDGRIYRDWCRPRVPFSLSQFLNQYSDCFQESNLSRSWKISAEKSGALLLVLLCTILPAYANCCEKLGHFINTESYFSVVKIGLAFKHQLQKVGLWIGHLPSMPWRRWHFCRDF